MKKKLEDKFPELRTERYSFSNPIKFVAQAFIGWDKEKDEKGRKLLQDIGKVGREYDIHIWVKHLLGQMDKNFGSNSHIYPANFVIVDDWRFPDELSYLKFNPILDVITVRVFGRGGLDGDVAFDVSENSLPEVTEEALEYYMRMNPNSFGYDFQINNDNNLELLETKLDKVLDEISKQYIVK